MMTPIKMPKREHRIYVIELDMAVLRERKFLEANPGYVAGKPCVYVGMTTRTPETRFAQHKSGYKAARFARRYGTRLKPRQYRRHNPMTREEAKLMEVEKARRLRNRGWGVWQR
jgi:predicted GIY-YIG superfamily endonuclease